MATGLTAEKIRIAKEMLARQPPSALLPTECDKVVAVLGDDNTYPCIFQLGHPGRCQPDYEAI